MSTEQLSSVKTACANARELIVWNEEFFRGVEGILKWPSVANMCNTDYILSIFTKLKEDKVLNDEEKEILLNFVQNQQVAKAGQTLLSRLWNGKIDVEWGIDIQKGTSILSYLQEIFAEDGFAKVKNDILEQAWVDVSERVWDTLNYTQEVQDRRDAWDELADELSTDSSKVEVTNSWISIEWVANFELNDDEPASYNELKKAWKLDNHADDEWDKLSMFMKSWTREQKEAFLTKVMKMDTTREGDWNFYISTSASPRSGNGIRGLFIGRDAVGTGWLNRNGRYSVRRVQN